MAQMSAQVFFVTAGAQDVATVPFAALKPTADSDIFTARVFKNEKIEERAVKIGVRPSKWRSARRIK